MAYNEIHGTANGERLDGTPGDDHIFGYAGDDFLLGHGGDDWLEGGEGGDRLAGLDGDDRLEGGSGHDYLQGFAGNDHLSGGGGHDYLQGHGGTNVLDGGAGIDRIGYFWSGVGVEVSLALAGVQATGSSFDTIVDIENLSGSPHDDRLTGNGEANILWGSGGSDVMLGLGGDDLFGVTAGTQSVDGGAGNDTLGFANPADASAPLTVSLLLQGAPQESGLGPWTLSGIENLVGGAHDDRLVGDGEANVLAGFLGGDTLVGNGGDDVILGDGFINIEAAPPYYGSGPAGAWPSVGAGDDVLIGGAGGDTLVGGGGRDVLIGGPGPDLFRFLRADESTVANPDHIADFDFREDRIDFSQMLPDGVEPSQARGGFTGEAGEILLEYDRSADSTLLALDADGDGSADLAVTMAGRQNVPPGWFDRIFSGDAPSGPGGLEAAAHRVPDHVELPAPGPDVFFF